MVNMIDSYKNMSSNTMDNLNSFILQQVIKKRSRFSEGTIQDQKHQKDHFKNLVQHIGKISDGQAIVSYDDANFRNFDVTITPKDGPYEHGKFPFHFKLHKSYPTSPPQIVCGKKVYHPNIDDEGEICLSTLSEWSVQYNDLLDCVQGLLFILQNPNLDDPFSPYFAPGENVDEFYKNVKTSMQGGEVYGTHFDNICI